MTWRDHDKHERTSNVTFDANGNNDDDEDACVNKLYDSDLCYREGEYDRIHFVEEETYYVRRKYGRLRKRTSRSHTVMSTDEIERYRKASIALLTLCCFFAAVAFLATLFWCAHSSEPFQKRQEGRGEGIRNGIRDNGMPVKKTMEQNTDPETEMLPRYYTRSDM